MHHGLEGTHTGLLSQRPSLLPLKKPWLILAAAEDASEAACLSSMPELLGRIAGAKRKRRRRKKNQCGLYPMRISISKAIVAVL